MALPSNIMFRTIVAVAVVLALAGAAPAVSDTGAAFPTIDDYYIDFAVPDLTALSLIGVNASSVARPGGMKELAFAVLNAAQDGSMITSGVAVEWAPGLTFAPPSLDAYRASLLKNLQLSFATVGRETATDLGLGARWTFFDRADVRRDTTTLDALTADILDTRSRFITAARPFIGAVLEQLSATLSDSRLESVGSTLLDEVLDIGNPPEPLIFEAVRLRIDQFLAEQNLEAAVEDDEVLDALVSLYIRHALERKQVLNQLDSALRAAKAKRWNDAVLSLGAGYVWSSASSTWKGLRGESFAAIFGLAVPATDHGQWLMQIEYRGAARDGAAQESYFAAGTRLLAGGSDRRVSGEARWSVVEHDDPVQEGQFLRLTLGAETRIATGFWVEIAVGGQTNLDDGGPSDMLALGNIKYAFHKKGRFDTD